MSFRGRCLCGAVSFTASSAETHFHAFDHKPAGYAFAGELSRLTEAEVLATFSAGQ